MEKSIFQTLNAINVNDHTEKKNGLTYLSWAWAWAEVKKAYPDANYTVYERPDGTIYWTDGRTCWVKTGVTIGGIEHVEYLPVMDVRNRSIAADAVTSFDVNKAIQRSLTKACARHGLGLYIYAGEDLPEEEEAKPKEAAKTAKAAPKAAAKTAPKEAPKMEEKTETKDAPKCEECGKEIITKDIESYIKRCKDNCGAVLCPSCAKMRLRAEELKAAKAG